MPLTELQRRVARIVLALDDASEFALAGGAALVIHDVVDRGTRDIDCFGPSVDAVNRLVDPVLIALAGAGLRLELVTRNHGFATVLVADEREQTRLDLGFDPADHVPTVSDVGPVRALEDLAGDKLLALFGRAAARDFIDVAALLRRFEREQLCELAAAKDLGFSVDVLADAFSVLPTYDRVDEFPALSDSDYDALIALYRDWQTQLRSPP